MFEADVAGTIAAVPACVVSPSECKGSSDRQVVDGLSQAVCSRSQEAGGLVHEALCHARQVRPA